HAGQPPSGPAGLGGWVANPHRGVRGPLEEVLPDSPAWVCQQDGPRREKLRTVRPAHPERAEAAGEDAGEEVRQGHLVRRRPAGQERGQGPGQRPGSAARPRLSERPAGLDSEPRGGGGPRGQGYDGGAAPPPPLTTALPLT